jgi:pyruvate/2-oxoglutarate dehydrogenase complex dihydrolipoamide acyltransferase (E2) component
VGATVVKLTPQRELVYHAMQRGQRFHACISGACDIDVSDLMSLRQEKKKHGEKLNFTAAIVKATGMAMAKHPRFNRQLFHGMFRPYEVCYDRVVCGLIVVRMAEDGEQIVFSAAIHDPDTLSVAEIAAKIRYYQTTPLAELPEYAAFRRALGVPSIVRTWMSYKIRSDHVFNKKILPATYMVTSFSTGVRSPGYATQAITPYCASFIPGTLADKPWVVDGSIQIRKVLSLCLVGDHHLVDGAECAQLMTTTASYLATPAKLGLEATTKA